MLGFSLPKILVLIVIVMAVWYGFKIFGRGRNVSGGGSARKQAGQEKADASLEMKPCEVCGDYVAAPASTASDTNGLFSRSAPKVDTWPWPGMKATSLPKGQSCSVIERISVA